MYNKVGRQRLLTSNYTKNINFIRRHVACMYGWIHYFNVKKYDVNRNTFPVPCHLTNYCAIIVVMPTHVAIWCKPYVQTDEGKHTLFLSSLIYFVYIFCSKIYYHYWLSTFVGRYIATFSHGIRFSTTF
jgi:hypothetical protein